MSDRGLFGERRSRRNPARFLAPVFLIAVIAGTYVVVHHGVTQITQNTSTSKATRRNGSHLTRKQRRYARDRFYVVRPGDSLTAIAIRTGVGIGTLQELNPRINPNSLQVGQRIRLRR